jgi:hypothetical protein
LFIFFHEYIISQLILFCCQKAVTLGKSYRRMEPFAKKPFVLPPEAPQSGGAPQGGKCTEGARKAAMASIAITTPHIAGGGFSLRNFCHAASSRML